MSDPNDKGWYVTVTHTTTKAIYVKAGNREDAKKRAVEQLAIRGHRHYKFEQRIAAQTVGYLPQDWECEAQKD